MSYPQGVDMAAAIAAGFVLDRRDAVPAVIGVPVSCGAAGLHDIPGGTAPVSDQVNGATPPLATVNVNPG